ncbi:MAG: glycosyltransferase family 2 protein [Desulfurococcaceae archaeon]
MKGSTDLNSLYIIGVVAAVLVLAPQICTFLVHTFYIVMSRVNKRKRTVVQAKDITSTSSEISFILPVRKEPLEYIARALNHVKSLGLPNYEIILVSDDSEEDKEQILKLVENARKEGINVWFIWRSEPVGMRTGALNVGLYASIGRYIYVYDVDTMPERDFFYKAVSLLEECDTCLGVVGRWEPLNLDSRVSEALAFGLEFIRKILFDARSRLGFHIYPLGTGTLYKAYQLKEVLKGWDPARIQDDAELGARLLCKGYRVVYLDEYAVKVENPSTYKSFRVQQSRWAYGALDAALSRLKCFIFSKSPLIVKLEALLYLLQYVPSALSFTGAVVLSIITALNPADYVERVFPLFLAWFSIMIIYTLLMYFESHRKSVKEFLTLSGRLTALGTASSPYVAVSTIKALLRVKEEYKRTPKGLYQKMYRSPRFPLELALGAYFAFGAIPSFMKGYYLTSITLCMFMLPFLYVTLRFRKDVFYR